MRSRGGGLPCSWLWSVSLSLTLLLLQKLAESHELGLAAGGGREDGTAGRGIASCSPPLFVFGASMLDTGENGAAKPYQFPSGNMPYGRDYWGHPANRLSNGRVITDHLCQALGLPFLHPYLELGVTDFKQGVNFASSGSTGIRSGCLHGSPYDLTTQIGQFQFFKNHSLLRAASVSTFPTWDDFKAGVYILEIGDNDFIQLRAEYDNEMVFFRDLLSVIKRAIEKLYSEGARRIILFNVMPIGCMPEFAALRRPEELDEFGCYALVNKAVSHYNMLLQTFIDELRPRHPEANLVVFDFNRVFINAISNPSPYGVTNVHASCCGAGGGKYNYMKENHCGSAENVDLVYVCDNPTEYIFWDYMHPTDSFAGYIASALLSGTFSMPPFRLDNSCNVYKS